MTWEPKIAGFLCNWCSYTGADLAGTSRLQYPANIRVIRLMCTGRMDPVFIFKAFQAGADGVLVSGCHPGDCHYQEGNFKALRRALLLKHVIKDLGIHPERFKLIWVSASEGDRWAKFSHEFTETIRALGPLKLNHDTFLPATVQEVSVKAAVGAA